MTSLAPTTRPLKDWEGALYRNSGTYSIRDDRKHIANITTILPVDSPLSDWVAAAVDACKPQTRARCELAIPAMRERYSSVPMGNRWVHWFQAIAKGQ